MKTGYRLVLGTGNRKKGEELAGLLTPLGFRVSTLSEIRNGIEVAETGSTFAENAALKATQQAQHLGKWVMGEDSGLVVDALDGRPGVFSARYSGEGATDESNNQLLLQEMAGIPLERRSAHYVCHACVADPRGEIRAVSEGKCRGRIRFAPSGQAGFGYDPLFEIPEYHLTFGELGDHVKSVLSHRARALRRLVPQLLDLIRQGVWETGE